MEVKDHRLIVDPTFHHIVYERRPARDLHGEPVPKLYDAWISLNNPSQLNSYTTDALREVNIALREASCDFRRIRGADRCRRSCVLLGRQHKRVRGVLRGPSG